MGLRMDQGGVQGLGRDIKARLKGRRAQGRGRMWEVLYRLWFRVKGLGYRV